MTTLDLTKGYYHVGMELGSMDKTAFVTPFGKYLFGLCHLVQSQHHLPSKGSGRELHPFACGLYG